MDSYVECAAGFQREAEGRCMAPLPSTGAQAATGSFQMAAGPVNETLFALGQKYGAPAPTTGMLFSNTSAGSTGNSASRPHDQLLDYTNNVYWPKKQKLANAVGSARSPFGPGNIASVATVAKAGSSSEPRVPLLLDFVHASAAA